MIQQTSPAGLNTAEPHSALSVNTQPRFVSVKHTTVFSLVICVCLAEVTLLMEMFTLQLSTSLSSTCCSSLDSCRHTVFDYSTELIGLQEALTQIPTANMEQLERFLLGMNEQRDTDCSVHTEVRLAETCWKALKSNTVTIQQLWNNLPINLIWCTWLFGYVKKKKQFFLTWKIWPAVSTLFWMSIWVSFIHCVHPPFNVNVTYPHVS